MPDERLKGFENDPTFQIVKKTIIEFDEVTDTFTFMMAWVPDDEYDDYCYNIAENININSSIQEITSVMKEEFDLYFVSVFSSLTDEEFNKETDVIANILAITIYEELQKLSKTTYKALKDSLKSVDEYYNIENDCLFSQ